MYTVIKIKYLSATNSKGARLRFQWREKAETIGRQYAFSADDQIRYTLEARGFDLVYCHWEKDTCYAFCK